MAFRQFRDEVKELLEEAAASIQYPIKPVSLEEPPRPEFGDLSSTLAFDLAKTFRKEPLKIAEELRSKIKIRTTSLIGVCSIAAPGYLNFTVDQKKFSTLTLSKLMNEKPGFIDIGKGKRVIVEHTSVNPNKALHMGHLRNVVIGDTIFRLLQFTNHNVTVLNYVDDSGLQVSDIIVGFKFLGFPEKPTDNKVKFDHYCGNTVYVKVNQIYSEKPETEQYRRLVLKEMENHDSEVYNYAKSITEHVLEEQLKTCWRIKAFYDCLNFESHIISSKMWERILQYMKERKLVVYQDEGKNAGCLVIKGVGDQDKVLIRSDGTATYIAKDIPYAAWKLGLVADTFNYEIFMMQENGEPLWRTTLSKNTLEHPSFNNADIAINVIDIRQGWLQKIIAGLLKEIDHKGKEKQYIHLGYEIVSLSKETARELGIEVGDKDFVHMSGRAGIYINADDVLDKLKNLAYQETKSRNPDANEEWLAQISESISVGAIRYSLIKQDIGKILVFDLRETLKLEGETGPYLQYTYARASSILEKYGKPISEPDVVDALTEQEERLLVRELSKIDIVIEETIKNLQPNKLGTYTYGICLLFNTFYEKYPVIHEENERKRIQRLLLVRAFTRALTCLMSILGIEGHKRI